MTSLLPFALTCLLIELTPGPNMTYLALVAAQAGRRAGFAAVAGVAFGLTLLGITAALGLSTALAASPIALKLLRWGGVAYLLYLAWEAWRDATKPVQKLSELNRRFFGRGLLTNLLNPKALVFYVVVLPAFIDPARGLIEQSFLLTGVYVLIATCVHLAIVSLAGSLQPLLARGAIRETSGTIFAIALAGVAVWFASSNF